MGYWWLIAVGVVGGYVGISLVFLHFPHLLHKKKQVKFSCRHISHRGGSGERLENTMAAFRHAVVDCRTDMLELDCQLTLDGQVVVAHENRLDRLAGVDGSISDYRFEDLPDIRSSLPLTPNRNNKVHLKANGSIVDRRIPLLRDVFTAFPDTPINLDVAADSKELLDKVEAMIKEFDREAITPWGDFRDSMTRKCYEKNPNIPLLFSLERVALVLICFYTGLLSFIPLKETFFELVMPSAETQLFDLTKRQNKLTWRHRALVWIADLLIMRPMLFRHLQRRGMKVLVWVLDDDKNYEKIFRLGADGIMSDFPTNLRDFLDKKESLLSKEK